MSLGKLSALWLPGATIAKNAMMAEVGSKGTRMLKETRNMVLPKVMFDQRKGRWGRGEVAKVI